MIKNNLKMIREEKELTQIKIANLLNITRSAYSLWEINKNIILLQKLNDYCNFFNYSMDYIFNLPTTTKYNSKKIILNYKDIGKRIKDSRKELNLTQEKLAKKLNTTHSAISAYENGKTHIPTIFLIEICKITKKEMDWYCGKK